MPEVPKAAIEAAQKAYWSMRNLGCMEDKSLESALTAAAPFMREYKALNDAYLGGVAYGRAVGFADGVKAAAQRVENLYTSNGPQCADAIRALKPDKK